ncbi:hypothetical protein EYD45_14970 [Hyunsoonleella flava]|uniref:Uncharacterized protein n=1 Tax=Hyunsoonleella flava TaxID=2527939 RepID=A0A4Q9FH12_9FLAO|nr:hypothetical protein [Hyunsoonleella flava]TBN00236.1 hypothetical protein EYD45_14970 [Hyunsoonleella flava]
MKSFLFLLVLTCFFISCDTSKKYERKWCFDPLKLTNNDLDYPASIYIENDSIKFNYYAFDYWHKFPLTIDDKLFFNNWKIPICRIEDTIRIGQIPYIKDEKDSVFNWWWSKPILKIDLPKIDTTYFQFHHSYKSQKNYIYFGKRIDNNKYNLQLNDRYANIQDLPAFLAFERASLGEELIPFHTTVLYMDFTTPMKYAEGIFHELKKVNQLKIQMISDILLKYNNEIGLYYEHEGLTKKLPYFYENEHYVPDILDLPSPPPPPPPYFPDFWNKNVTNKIIILKRDDLYFDEQIITKPQLKELVNKWVKNKNGIFSLYDLESSYGNFLEMTAIINSVYQNERNKLSKIKFNKSLSDLNQDEIVAIKEEIPMYHVWSYSIPHFSAIVKNNDSFFGIKTLVLDSVSKTK